jgi:hypothetical protein
MASYKDIQKGAAPISPPLKIRYKGVWDMQDLYESTINYLKERKYKFHEKTYKHKHPSPFGVERQYVWQAEQKYDEWLKAMIDIFIHTYDAQDIEVMTKSGEKKIFTKGKIYITLKIYENWDYQERFNKNSFWGQVKVFYQNYIIKKRRMLSYGPRFRNELVSLYHFMQRKLKTEARDSEYTNIAGVHRRPV